MKKIVLILVTLFSIASFRAIAQKINYDFGKESDVIDSIKYVVDWYKKQYKTEDLTTLNLYVLIDYCNGYFDVFISQFVDADENMKRLAKKTNRFVPISKSVNLPVLFGTDILNLNDRQYVNMNGYYLKVEKDEKYVWRVVQMNQTF